MTVAVLVYGPASAGNHLTKRVLAKLGCRGSIKDKQPFDRGLPNALNTGPIMWGHSVPSNDKWSDVGAEIVSAASNGYSPWVIVVTRGMYPTICSQLKRERVPNRHEAASDIVRAMQLIMEGVGRASDAHKVRTLFLSYEELTTRPVAVTKWLAEELDLDWPGAEAFGFVEDRNGKHWEEER